MYIFRCKDDLLQSLLDSVKGLPLGFISTEPTPHYCWNFLDCNNKQYYEWCRLHYKSRDINIKLGTTLEFLKLGSWELSILGHEANYNEKKPAWNWAKWWKSYFEWKCNERDRFHRATTNYFIMASQIISGLYWWLEHPQPKRYNIIIQKFVPSDFHMMLKLKIWRKNILGCH